MYYTVAQISELTNLSKASIYNRIKLKEFERFIIKKQGITYINSNGLKQIQEDINFKSIDYKEIETDRNNLTEDMINSDAKVDNDEHSSDYKELESALKGLNLEYINSLKLEIELLKKQLITKDTQLEAKDEQIIGLQKLIENNQVLLKQQQDKEIKQLQLEEHFQEVDEKLLDLREKMENKKKPKKSIFRIFNNDD